MIKKSSRLDVEKYLIASLKLKESYKIFEDKQVEVDFFTPGTHATLYRFCQEFFTSNRQCLSPDILTEHLSSIGVSREKMANLVSSFKLIQTIDVKLNKVSYYSDVLKDFHAQSSLKTHFEEAVSVTKGTGPAKNIEAVQFLSQKIVSLRDQLMDKHIDMEVIDIADMQNIMCEEFDKKINQPWLYQGVLSGIKQVDKAFGTGLRPGELTVFLAPPAGGKTTTMLSLADAMYQNAKKNIVYISLEMENKRIASKMLSNNSQIHSGKIEAAQFTRQDVESIKKAFSNWKSLKQEGVEFKFVHLCASGRVPMSRVEECLQGILREHSIDVVYVDYLECLTSGGNEDRWIEMGTICKFLRGVGSKYGFTTVSAVQLKREAIERIRKSKDGKVEFGADDAQGSNQISADCDRIYVLVLDKNDKKILHWHTAKDRYGDSSYTTKLCFQGECSRVYGDKTEYNHDNLFSGQDITQIAGLDDEDTDLVSQIDKQIDYLSGDEVTKGLKEFQKIDSAEYEEVNYEELDDEEIVFQ